jgi:hypothetical protein
MSTDAAEITVPIQSTATPAIIHDREDAEKLITSQHLDHLDLRKNPTVPWDAAGFFMPKVIPAQIGRPSGMVGV